MIDALAAAVFLLPSEDPPAPEPTPNATQVVEPDTAKVVKKAPPMKKVYKGTAKIRKGMQGRSVLRVQMQLNGIGKPAPMTGVFDKPTVKAYKSFQDKFGYWPTGTVSQKQSLLLKKLYGKGKLPQACMSGKVLCIDKTQSVLRMMVNGKQKLVTDVRFGSEQTPTRNGKHRVHSKIRYLISDLAGTPMPYSVFFSGGQAVHFSPGFRRDGYNGASLGCVNVRVYKDARTIYQNTPVGGLVYVYRS
ncbi:MAG: L,D-transpeptidase [Actinobacteria bacterium]|nr:L,D-transpeptidase [Micrococcales bacterium]MCB9427557.1 L,D-transpeptidase [Actinomycetota bacterium]HPE13727.1 L,D-transpeptidase [Actinomycetota bacterium]HPJ20163.1 L,D-transpeptidase [Actinomycetota bacterium]HPQ85194.1 L,D-transpeptidase [Actinomycetota bacterium]